ncbi:site-specific integrase [Jatrophihabitans endophyticus]|uniref:tyrosine-type recombinase/integrase n=1 Tax=Jatrophihabitans endophyticus TaxID=1206085 RepID=UPI0019DC770E|nr:site-specific integrase [Jatrophihabitans endophyticus]MBE7189877.1 site-specific integrase [Jatrophihabitans endophyticus]
MASIEKRIRNGQTRWYARYRDAADRQRTKTFDRKIDAERFVTGVSADLLRGSYIDPDAGRVCFQPYAEQWLANQSFERTTYEAVRTRLRTHAFPVLGVLELRAVKPSTIQSWLRGLSRLSPTYQRTIYVNVASVFAAAVDDELIAKNPCRARSVRTPRVQPRRVIPWTAEQVHDVRSALPDRYRAVVTIGAGLGLRQGEIFGLSPDDVDFLRGTVQVRRQVKLLSNGSLIYALPKGRKTRDVPLAETVRDDLASFLAAHPANTISLPWEIEDGAEQGVPLIITTRERSAATRTYFNSFVWKRALLAAGVEATRENGCHALRHFYASVLLDAGESIKAVSEYLGHSDAGFTLRTYTHLMPSSSERSRRAINAAFRSSDHARGSSTTG